MLSVVASVIIFAGSALFTTVVFPDCFSDLRAIQEQMLKPQGMSDEDINSAIAATSAMQAPIMTALTGEVGTIVTGLVVAATAGALWWKKWTGRTCRPPPLSHPAPELETP